MRTKSISKKVISLLMVTLMFVSVFAVGISGMTAQARTVGAGTGAESFDYVDVYQTTQSYVGTSVNTSVTVKVTDSNYRIRINSISESLPFYANGVTDGNLSVSYTAGEIVSYDEPVAFTVSGTVASATNSTVRYVVNFDVIDAEGNTTWKNLTTYGYGTVSGTAKQTGAVGTQSGTPGILHQKKGSLTNSDVCNWRWKPGLNPHMAPNYVQPEAGSVKASTQNYSERSAWRDDTKFTIYPKVTGGTLPNFITFNSKGIFFTDSDFRWTGSGPSNAVVKETDEDFGSTLDQVWASWTTPTVSGYWSFTYDLAGDFAETIFEDTNYTGSVNVYNITDADKANAKTMLEKVVGLNGNFTQGYYVQKDLYTEASWNTFINAMDVAAFVAYATPNATWGYRQACEKATTADDKLLEAFNGLTLNTTDGEHTHDWTNYHATEQVVEPTCTEMGTSGYTCLCGETKTVVDIPATGHKMSDWTVHTAPSCGVEGVEIRSCTSCGGNIETKELPALEHNWEITSVVEPACNVKGYTNYKCTICSQTRKDDYVDALTHTFGEWQTITEPTCTTEGMRIRSCTRPGCNYPESEILSPLGHTYESEVIAAPTCTEKGQTKYTCSCGDTYTEADIDALGHTEVTETVDATCTEDGSVTVTCSVCGEVISEETISATGHSMGDWEVTEYPTFEENGSKEKACANCDYTETETLNPVKLRTTRIISSEIEGNTIRIVGYTNADSIGFYRTTAAGEDIIFDMYYDEEDLANEPTPIKYGDNSPRWIIYNSRWAQYAVDGKYTDKMTIAGAEYNFEVVMNSRELEENDVVLVEKFTNIAVDNENKVITLIPPKGTESVTLKQTSREYDEFTYTIDADNYDNVTLNEVSGAYRGSYTIAANGEFETEITVTVNKGKYNEADYTLKVIFIDFDLVNELKPLRGTVSLETYEDGREYLKVTMLDGQTSTGIYKTGKGTAITGVSVNLADGTMTEKDDLYVAYAKSNKVNPTGEVTISLSNGSVLTYDIVFDMGITEAEVDPLSELRLIRATAAFDADGTLRITRNSGLAQSAGAGFYATTTAGETVTFTTTQGAVYEGRTDAFIAYLTQNTSNVKGTISYKLSDGTDVEYNAVIDLGLGDEYVAPEEPVYDLATDLRAIRGTVSVEENTVTIKVAEGKTMTGLYNTTASGATVEITTENGTFAARDDAYVAYIASNTANVEGLMTVTFADGTTQEYTVIFDLGL